MTAEDKIEQAIKIIDEILRENIDISNEKWYYYLSQAKTYLNLALDNLK